jgi:hypothetical protein
MSATASAIPSFPKGINNRNCYTEIQTEKRRQNLLKTNSDDRALNEKIKAAEG